MALTRKLLKGMGLTDEQVDTIIEAHTDTVNGLKDQIDEYKDEAEKLPKVQKELADAKKELETVEKDGYKDKYEATLKEFEDYKDSQAKEATRRAKDAAYRELLVATGVSEKRLDSIMKLTDLDKVDLDKDGKLKGQDKLTESIKDTWGDFIVTIDKKGADVSNPPGNTGGNTTSKDEILKMKDPVKRQAAIAENLDLFEKKGE